MNPTIVIDLTDTAAVGTTDGPKAVIVLSATTLGTANDGPVYIASSV